jgi:drug/metabolite transporter (DMT)-like permease
MSSLLDQAHPHHRKLGWRLSKETIGEVQIIVCGVFFGLTFVGERKAMIDGMNAYTFNFARYFVSVFALVILQPLFYMLFESKSDSARELEQRRLQEHNGDAEAVKWAYRRDVVLWGGLISLVCFGGATLQQIGMKKLSASKTGFITRLQVIVVPLIEWAAPGVGGHMTRSLFAAICVSVAGLYLLSGCTRSACLEGHMGPGEIWVIASMLCWALCSVFSVLGCRYVDSLTITYVHFVVVTVLCLIVAIAADKEAFEYPFREFMENWLMILGT